MKNFINRALAAEKRIFIFIAIALLCASCENEKEPPSGAGDFPQITLTNNSDSKAFLCIFNTNGVRIADTDKLAPNTSAQAKFWKAFSYAGEDVIIKVYKREDPAVDTKIYQQGFRLHVIDKYTFTVGKNYNVSYRANP